MKRDGVSGIAGFAALVCLGVAGVVHAGDAAATPPTHAAIAATSTLDNLKAAYLTQYAAMEQYKAFAAKASGEGYSSVALLFRAATLSADIQVNKEAGVIRKLGGQAPVYKPAAALVVNSTKENLQSLLAAEIGAKNVRYAIFAKQAEMEKNEGAMYAFKGVLAAEVEYVKFFQQALADLDGWKGGGKSFAVCTICSYPVMGTVPGVCPVCQSPREKFTVVK